MFTIQYTKDDEDRAIAMAMLLPPPTKPPTPTLQRGFSRESNGDRIHVILNGEPLEEVDCFKYLWSQVAADGGCKRDVVHRMNELGELGQL